MTLLASGEYGYWCDGVRQDVREPWRLQATAAGLHLWGQRWVNGQAALEVDADYEGLHCRALRLRAQDREGLRSVQYQHRDDTLHWQLEGDLHSQKLIVPAGCALFPLLRVAAGPLQQLLLAAQRSVAVPNIRATAASTERLQALLSKRHAVLQAQDAQGEQHCRYYGGEYGEAGADYWLDARGLLQRYRWASAQGTWEARLEALELQDGFEWAGTA